MTILYGLEQSSSTQPEKQPLVSAIIRDNAVLTINQRSLEIEYERLTTAIQEIEDEVSNPDMSSTKDIELEPNALQTSRVTLW
jgi:hypothetical protein